MSPVRTRPTHSPESESTARRQAYAEADARAPRYANPFDFEVVHPDNQPVEPAPKPRILSPQQEAILAWVRTGRGSAFIEAVAGAGKTTTLVEVTKLLKGSVAFTAYNRKIAEEIGAKLDAAGVSRSQVRAGTFHSFGFSALGRSVSGRLEVDERKKARAMHDAVFTPADLEAVVSKMVSFAKQTGAGFLWPIDGVESLAYWHKMIEHHDLLSRVVNPDRPGTTDELINYAQKALYWSNNTCAQTLIDYDDMIYLPLLRNLRIWQNDWVLVDEAQDTNPVRRALARRMLKPGGRAVFVGDPAQAIYGFTGADADSIDQIRKEFGTVSLPLTVTYRCPKSVVAMAQQWVSHISAHESAPEGKVRSLTADQFHAPDVRATLIPQDAILCRNTRPLVSLAFSLIRNGIACHVEGRDIGAGLLALVNRWKVSSINALRKNLEAYRERETAKAMAKGNEYAAEAVSDRVDTLFILMDGCADVDCVRAKISRLFADTPEGRPSPTLTLSTIHKAKGREWDRVFLLGFNTYCPSPYARQEWQKEQERNLMYVAVTRAKSELVVLPALA